MTAVCYRLWAMSFQAGILILVVLTVRFLLSTYPRIYSYGLWALVGIRLLCPVWVESPFSLQPDLSGYSGRGELYADSESWQQSLSRMLSGSAGTESDGAGSYAQAGEQQAGIWKEGQLPTQEEGIPGGITAGASLPENTLSGEYQPESAGEAGGNDLTDQQMHSADILKWLGLFYLMGVGGLSLFYLIQYLRMKRRVADAVREKGNVWLCEGIDSPFVMGVFSLRIYLPYGISGPEKRYVLRHERVHIRHFDPLIRMTGALCTCLHWWNPLVWLAVYFMNQDMEMFCDETVLRRAPLEERKAYARALLVFAEKESRLGTGLAFGESHTKKRVKNIMKRKKKNALVVCLVMLLAVFCVIALLTVPGTGGGAEENSQDSGAGDEANRQSASDDASGDFSGESVLPDGNLSEESLAWLAEICYSIPDFSTREEMDAAFWKNYLFVTYTSDFDREEENRYSEQYGSDIPYLRVSHEEADERIRQIFGSSLEEYGIDPRELGTGDNNLIYEEGFWLIAASDSPAFEFSMENVTTTDILTEVTLQKSVEGETLSRVMLYLLPAENDHGFRLDGKEEIPISRIPEGQALENQTFDVEMKPYGNVTFAAYAPQTDISPYADVTFKLLQNGEEIYSFPLKGTGVREDQSVFEEMAAVAFPDLNRDGYTDVITIANYRHESGPVPPQVRIFTYHPDGYFLEENYLEDAYNFSHEEKTVADIEAFAAQYENQDYFARTSVYGRWQISGYKLPGVYALSQEEIDGYVGAGMEYGVASLWTSLDGEERAVEGYERRTVTIQEMEADFSISRDALELTAGELTFYQLNGQQDSLFGTFFYLVDTDHALIYYEGVFFEAERE